MRDDKIQKKQEISGASAARETGSTNASPSIEIRGLSRRYGDLQVLENLSLTFLRDHIYCLMAPSGRGKTTLLRLILGLEQPDAGLIGMPQNTRFSAVFQEDRLCESFSPLENVLLTADRSLSKEAARRELACLLPEESLTRPVRTLSGGMKRRAAIVRAMLAPSEVIIMDEPFTGLDEDTRKLVIRYILEKRNGRLLIISTHQEEDVELLGAELVQI